MQTPPTTSQPSTPEQQAQRRERRLGRLQRRRQQLRARLILGTTIFCCLALLGAIGFFYLRIQGILAYNGGYTPVDGITCDRVMYDNGYHIHAHLSIYVNGQSVTIPKGVGMASDLSCFYWLHTHTSDGILHIESPDSSRKLGLNNFLTIWHDHFASMGFPAELTQSGGWQLFINGAPYSGRYGSPLTTLLPLSSHEILTLEYGSPLRPPDTPASYHFPPDLPR